MRLAPVSILALVLVASGCTLTPFEPEKPASKQPGTREGSGPSTGSGPVIGPAPEGPAAPPSAEPGAVPAPTTPLPHERPRTAPASLSPASKSLVAQAQAQRKKGDLPGATAALERALRIEPNNPLLWIEMGRLRMDQRNYPQAESMGRKALSMSVGDSRTQSSAWLLIADSLKARGRNPQAQEALAKSKELAQF
jgi:Flp pilus assembly protein TadD